MGCLFWKAVWQYANSLFLFTLWPIIPTSRKLSLEKNEKCGQIFIVIYCSISMTKTTTTNRGIHQQSLVHSSYFGLYSYKHFKYFPITFKETENTEWKRRVQNNLYSMTFSYIHIGKICILNFIHRWNTVIISLGGDILWMISFFLTLFIFSIIYRCFNWTGMYSCTFCLFIYFYNDNFLNFLIYFAFGSVGSLLLRGLFSSCSRWGPPPSYSAWVFGYSGLSCCKAQALGCMGPSNRCTRA